MPFPPPRYVAVPTVHVSDSYVSYLILRPALGDVRIGVLTHYGSAARFNAGWRFTPLFVGHRRSHKSHVTPDSALRVYFPTESRKQVVAAVTAVFVPIERQGARHG